MNLFEPLMLISLSAPKKMAQFHHGAHYLGGRFVPEAVFDKFKCHLPVEYEGSN